MQLVMRQSRADTGPASVTNPASADVGALLARVTAAEAERDAALAEIDKLHVLIKQLQRAQFGRRSESSIRTNSASRLRIRNRATP